MKKNIYIACTLGLLLAGLGSCELKKDLDGTLGGKLKGDEGMLNLNLSSKGESIVKAEGANTGEAPDINDFPVEIWNLSTNTIEMEFDTYKELKDRNPLVLPVGNYQVKAYRGKLENVSRTPYYEGVSNFSIIPGKVSEVKDTCRIQNIKVAINMTDDFLNVFDDDYSISITNDNGALFFNVEETAPVYLKAIENAKTIKMVAKVTNKETKKTIQQNYVIAKNEDYDQGVLKGGDFFNIKLDTTNNVKPGYITTVGVKLQIDLSMNETGITVEVPTDNITVSGGGETPTGSPSITGADTPYAISISAFEGGVPVPEVKVKIAAPAGIKNLFVEITSSSDVFAGLITNMGLGGTFDMANPSDELAEKLGGSLADGTGIGLLKDGETVKDKAEFLFDVSDFMPLLPIFGVATHSFKITVNDGVNAPLTKTLTVNITE